MAIKCLVSWLGGREEGGDRELYIYEHLTALNMTEPNSGRDGIKALKFVIKLKLWGVGKYEAAIGLLRLMWKEDVDGLLEGLVCSN